MSTRIDLDSTCCIICKNPESKKCSACKLVFYCGIDHQKKDWPLHKLECGKSVTNRSLNTGEKITVIIF